MPDTGFEPRRYLARSWRMLTQDKGWIKPVLLLALCLFVPVAGPIAVGGYLWEWARLTAWGFDSAPKQTGVSVGGCFKAGWRIFVVSLVWSLAIGAACWLLGLLGGLVGGFFEGLLGLVATVGSLLLGLVALVALMRAAVYEKIGPGFGLKQVFDMAGRDFGGLMRILGIQALGVVVCGAVYVVCLLCLIGTLLPMVLDMAVYTDYYMGDMPFAAIGSLLGTFFSTLFPWALIIGYGISVLSTIFELLTVNSVGLWVRQFNVGAWGEPGDPVPPAQPRPATWPGFVAQPGAGFQGYGDMAAHAAAGGQAVPGAQPAAAAQAVVNAQPGAGAPAAGPCAAPGVAATGQPAAGAQPAAGVAAPVVSAQAQPLPAQGGAVGGYQTPAQAQEEVPAMNDTPQTGAEPVVPPTQKDMYESAPERVTSWTSVVEPKDHATDHLDYQPQPTEPPAPADDHGVMPPTPQDIYGQAAGAVVAGPELALDDAPALAEAEVAGEDLASKPDDVAQTPVTPPTPADIHVTAADAEVAWTSVVEPKDDATDHLAYQPQPTEAPAPADDHGVTPPTQADLYKDASGRVAASPEVGLPDAAVAAEVEVIADDLRVDDPSQAPAIQPADGAPVPPYMAPAGDNGTEEAPIVTPLTHRDDAE